MRIRLPCSWMTPKKLKAFVVYANHRHITTRLFDPVFAPSCYVYNFFYSFWVSLRPNRDSCTHVIEEVNKTEPSIVAIKLKIVKWVVGVEEKKNYVNARTNESQCSSRLDTPTKQRATVVPGSFFHFPVQYFVGVSSQKFYNSSTDIIQLLK